MYGTCLNCQGIELTSDFEVGDIDPRTNRYYRGSIDIFLDGTNVVDRCVGLHVGEEGWVILYDKDEEGKRFFCKSCSDQAAKSLVYGSVVVVPR